MGKWTPIVKNLPHDKIGTLYTEDKLSVIDIAKQFNVNPQSIRKVLNNLGIQLDKNRYYIGAMNDFTPHNKIEIDINSVIGLVNQGKPVGEISEILQIPIYILRTRLKALNITPQSGFYRSVDSRVAGRRLQQIGKLANEKLNDAEWLRNQYITLQKSSREIAKYIGCGKKAVLSALRKHQIPISFNKTPTIESRLFGTVHCDSYWEKLVIEAFDKDMLIEWAKREPIALYLKDKSIYRPDFLIKRNRIYLIEVKPEGLLEYIEDKIETATSFCNSVGWDYKIITNPDNTNIW